ncbi:hypothetical protein LQX32_004077 [Salmonella enterica]|nr:hypothetical protein [Salmonella enterica]EGT2786636.1 hypothetical protein [Salmonella enterica subsp. enterica serovar Carmel]EDH1765346.1 hypothetical protein [Salmonella enterica]EIC5002081.1 hypothetical protein [Salmonella enterica]EIJ3932377.1 hypothetical protein [Salmonella enterica]
MMERKPFFYFLTGLACCMGLSACTRFTPPPLWQSLTGGVPASQVSTSGRSDNTIHPPALAGTAVPEPGPGHMTDAARLPPLPETITPDDRLVQCRHELRALQGIDSPAGRKNLGDLDEALASASRYVVLRPGLAGDMRQVMDSVHQARLARVCQKIHADLFSALLKRADNPQGDE